MKILNKTNESSPEGRICQECDDFKPLSECYSNQESRESESKLNKLCTCCEKNLPITYYYKKGKRFDSACKECMSKIKRKAYKKKKGLKNSKIKIAEGYCSIVVGELSNKLINDFSEIFSNFIGSLKDYE